MSANEPNFVAAVYDRRFRVIPAAIDRRHRKNESWIDI
jgi:hypothetical protein